MEITLVSGLKGQIRELRGKELQQLANPSLVRTGGAIDVLLGSAFLTVTDPGPYSFLAAGSRPNWERVLQGDHMDALVQIGATTFGDDYEFPVQCEEKRCRKRYDWGILLSDVPRKLLSAESAAIFHAGNRFEVVAPDGRRITHKLPTRAEEKLANKKRDSQQGHYGHIDSLLVRTIEVEGLTEAGKPPNIKRMQRYFEELSMRDVLTIYEAMDEQNCGLETSFETVCSFCGYIQTVHLPFGEAFFRPRKKKAASETDEETTTAPSDGAA